MLKKIIVVIGVLITLNLAISCSHYDELQKNTIESNANEDESHNSGKDCMSCHNQTGSEAADEGFWNIAGSVFKTIDSSEPQNNVTVELWSEPNGKGFKIYSLVSDKKGNFYTNKIVNFNNGCYPIIKFGNKTKSMLSSFKGGMSCNNSNCHGGLIDKININ
jgi:hypothetical protein